jgi:hypothetical protein
MTIANPKPHQQSMWAACRLQPWAHQNGDLLPDGSGDPRVVSDFYSWTDIGVGTTPQNFSITTLPTLPFAATLKSGGATLAITGSNMLSGPVPTVGGGGLWNYTGAVSKPIPINATKATSPATWEDRWDVDSSKHYIQANKARLTSMGWRVVYTGPANTCSGIITCTSAPIRDDPVVDKTNTTQQINFTLPTGVAGGSSTVGARLVPIDHIGIGAGYQGKDAVSARPEASLHGICRHSAPIYAWKEIYDQGLLLVESPNGDNQLSGNYDAFFGVNYPTTGTPVSGGGTAVFGSVYFYDNEWDTTTINFTNVTGSFRFETWQCVEFIPVPESAAYDMARVSTKSSPATVANVNTQASQVPVATTTKPG